MTTPPTSSTCPNPIRTAHSAVKEKRRRTLLDVHASNANRNTSERNPETAREMVWCFPAAEVETRLAAVDSGRARL